MKFRQALFVVVSAISLVGFGTSAAYATTINFDQKNSGASGAISYDGAGGPLVGKDITFSFVSADSTPTGTPSLDCNGCLLNFTTGSFNSKTGGIYLFNDGGSFELTGDVLDGASTVASGSLLSGQFTGDQPFFKSGGTSGTFNGDGTNVVDNGLSAYFGIDANSDFLFMNTNFSIGTLTFNKNDDGFSGKVDAADLATRNVPEPQELGIFGLGLALMVGSLLYRRKNGSDIG